MILPLLMTLALSAQEPGLGPKFTANGAVNFKDHVGIDQKLGDQVDLDLTFKDEAGKAVQLGDFFTNRPVVLVMAYYECPMLCTLVLNGTVKSFRAISDLDVGEDYEFVVVSIDPGESFELAREKRDGYVENYGRGESPDGWHFLTGEAEPIRQLAEQVGFRYVFDEKADEYAHASGIMVLTPKGQLSGYFYGVEFITKDLRLGLIQASGGEIGSLVDQVLLLCYQYDPSTGKYGVVITSITRWLGSLTVLLIGLSVFKMVTRDRRNAALQHKEAPHVG